MAAHDFSLGSLAKSLDPMVAPLVWLYLHAGSLETSGFLHLRESYPDSILVPGKTTKKNTRTQKNNTTLLSSPMISYLFLVKGSTPKKDSSPPGHCCFPRCERQAKEDVDPRRDPAIHNWLGSTCEFGPVNISVLALESNIATQLKVQHFICRFDTSSTSWPPSFWGININIRWISGGGV